MTSALWLMAALLALATPAWAQQTIRIGATPAVTFVVLYAAEHLGYFKAEGLAAQFADFEGGAEVTTAMVGGSIDFAGTYVERPMILAEKGFGAKNLLAILNRNPIFLVVRKTLTATDVKGLKGTKLGMTRAGSATDLALRALLRDAGLEPDRDVAVIAVGSSNSAAAALRAGQIDGFMGGEPGGAVIVHQLKIGRYFIEPLRDQGPKFLQYMTFPTLQASDRYIQANPQTVERVVRAVSKTQKRLREDPEAGVRVAQKFFPTLDVELLRTVIMLQRASYIPTITEDAVRTVNQFQKQAGVVKGDFAYDRLVAVQFKSSWDQ
ncbi:MAG TPA: ABC transporter substrate-binding protein [Candidatus Acidoferrales bacterium]|nr:ABC transporter substrate-binding protein [Candidatus Acidoferrales bacterium]